MTSYAQSIKGVAICVAILGSCLVRPYVQNANAKKIDACVSQARAEQQVLLICSSKGEVHKITIELAITSAQKKRGLMFRTKLEKNHGMLFMHKKPQVVKMWMKNTFIPLDMIFIDQKRNVVKIVEKTTPMSLRVISSSSKVIAVLEVAAGSAQRLGIKVGDKVKHRELDDEKR